MATEIKKTRPAKATATGTVQFGVPTEPTASPMTASPVVAPLLPVASSIPAKPESVSMQPAPMIEPAVAAEPTAMPQPASEPEPTRTPVFVDVPTPPPAPAPALISKELPMADQFTTAADAMKTGAEQMKNTMTATTENAMSQGKATMEQIAGKSREAVETGMKQVDELVGVARGNVEAMLASSRAATAGLEAIAHQVADFSRKSFEETTAAARAMTTVKTPNELMQLQNDFAKTQFDHAIAEMSKLSETMVKLMGEVFEPIQKSATVATDKVKAMAASMGNTNAN